MGREEIQFPNSSFVGGGGGGGAVIVLEYELSSGQIKPEPQKRATCFATFLQHKLKSDLALFTTHVHNCLATNQVVTGCQRFFQK